MKLIVVLSCVLMMSFSHADDDCSLDFKNFKSSLDKDSKQFKKVGLIIIDNKSKHMSQSAELVSGEKLEYSGGGCAHIGFTYTYTGLKSKPKTVTDGLKVLKTLIEKTGFKKNDDKNIMLSTLSDKENQKPEKFQEVYFLKCGDATCQFEMKPDSVAFKYDFAL